MKRQIRRMVFETNSSSVHSLTMCSEEEYEKFQNSQLVIGWRGDLKDIKEAIKEINKDRNLPEDYMWEDNKDELSGLLRDYDYDTYETYGKDYEWFEETYTTPNGERVIAFGFYGEDR